MSNEIVVSAPGKLFLLGEYAVLYGKPAIVIAIERRISAHLEEVSRGLSATVEGRTIEMPDLAKVAMDSVIPTFKSVVASMKVFEQLYGSAPPMRLETRSDVPVKGLGSSSASIVSTLGALHLAGEGRIEKEKLFQEAYQAKILSEGFGSESDIAASVFGGVQKIEKSRIERYPLISEGVVACYSGIPASTTEMYQIVSSLARSYPDLFESLLEAMEEVTVRGLDALRRNDYVSLGALMSVAHGLL
ncbi:MAG: mevalonate kinase, partial [Candidatus Geothermarchaeales archaeon]